MIRLIYLGEVDREQRTFESFRARLMRNSRLIISTMEISLGVRVVEGSSLRRFRIPELSEAFASASGGASGLGGARVCRRSGFLGYSYNLNPR